MASSKPDALQPPRSVLARCTEPVSGPVKIMVTQVVEGLVHLTDELFANADDYFFDMANKAETSQDQAAYFEAMRLVRLQRQQLATRFFDDLAAAIKAAWTRGISTAGEPHNADNKLDFDEITLLSDSEIEVSSALAMVSNRGQALCGHQIGCLTQTINSVSGTRPLDEADNPLGIKVLVRLFADAAAALELSSTALARLLMLFERDVTEKLGDVYGQALKSAAQAGTPIIEPAADQPQSRQPPSSRDFDAPDVGVMEFEDLRRRLNSSASAGSGARAIGGAIATGPAGSAGTSSAHPAAVVSAMELVNALSITQAKYLDHMPAPDAAGPSSFPNLQQFLVATPTDQGGFRNAGPTELDTLKLVSDLFEHIFRNPDVSLACMSLVARLQFPVLKIALVDKSFFGTRDHPARQFLNQLARDGIGWPSSGSLLARHRLYRFAETLVTEINDLFSDEPEVFQRALEAWKAQIAKKATQIESAERRINETELGKAKLNAARSIVERVLNRIAGRTLPRAVSNFITAQWSQVLVMICIKFGTSSDEWRGALGALNDLLGLCNPIQRSRNPTDPATPVPGLVSQLEQGLRLTGLNGSVHLEALTALQSALATGPDATAKDSTVMEPLSISDGRTPRVRKTLDPRLQELVPGVWIEVIRNDSDEGPLRCRLVVLVDQTQTFVFASDDGLKVYERSVPELLEELESGRVRILTEEPLVERAMSDLVDNLPTN
jgi:hypothetical protein